MIKACKTHAFCIIFYEGCVEMHLNKKQLEIILAMSNSYDEYDIYVMFDESMSHKVEFEKLVNNVECELLKYK